MNWEKGFRRMTLLSSLIAVVCCAGLAISLTLAQNSASFHPGPLTLEKMAEIPRANVREVPDGYWVHRWSEKELVGWCVVSGIGGGAIGFCAVWGIYRLFRWIALGFVSDILKPEAEHDRKQGDDLQPKEWSNNCEQKTNDSDVDRNNWLN